MKLITIIGLLSVLICCFCSQRTSKNMLQTDCGLLIENDKNRGVNFTDSLGAKYNLRYIPITITNDSTVSIHIQIAFSSDYDYPTAYGDQKFNVFPFPKEFKPDEVTWDTITYELGKSKLRDFLNEGFETPYILNETLEPGQKFQLSIGSLYPRPPKVCGALPNKLFTHSDKGIFTRCDWLMNKDQYLHSQIALGLKLNFKETCIIISCGHISYANN